MKARDNPFRSERIDALPYRSENFCWEQAEARLEELRGRGAIVGSEGHGKTTLLLEWATRLAVRGENVLQFRIGEDRKFLDANQRRLLCASVDACIFVDSAERLAWPGWLELKWRARYARILVIAVHRPGRLRTLLECRTSPSLLGELIEELTGVPGDCADLWNRHQGNVRLALHELYARCAN